MSRQAAQTVQTTAGAAAAGGTAAVARSAHLDQSLDKAHRLAVGQRHEAVTSEHLLFALTEDSEALAVLGASTGSVEKLRADIGAHLGQLPASAQSGKQILPNADLLKVLKLAAMAAQQSARRQIDGAIVLAAMIGDASTPAAGLLRAHGLTFNEVIRVLQKPSSLAPLPSQPVATHPAIAPPSAAQPASPGVAPTAATPASRPAPPVDTPAAEAETTSADTPRTVPINASAPAMSAETPDGPATDDILASVRARIAANAPPKPRRLEPRLPEGLPEPTPAAARDEPPPPPATLETKPDLAPPAPRPAPPPMAAPAPEPAAPVPPREQTLVRDSLAARVQSAAPPSAPAAATAPKTSAPPPTVTQPVAAAPPTPPPTALVPPTPVPPAPPRAAPPPLPRSPQPQQPSNAAPQRVPLPPPPVIDLRSLLTAAPRRMREGRTTLVEVTVPRRVLEIVAGPGHRWAPLRVATMRLRVADDAAHVELMSPETLWISPPRVHQGAADDAMWRWRVTPRRDGLFKLSLSGATRIVGSEGITGEVPIGEETIEVDAVRAKSRAWLVGVLLFGNLIALGLLAMIMSGRAAALIQAGWSAVRGLTGL